MTLSNGDLPLIQGYRAYASGGPHRRLTEPDYSPPAVQDAMATPVREPAPPAERQPSRIEQVEARWALVEIELHEKDDGE